MSRPSPIRPPTAGRHRWWLLLALLAVSAWLAFQQPDPTGPEIVQPRARASVSRPPAPAAAGGADERLLALRDRSQWPQAHSGQGQQTTDLFAWRSWTPPPKPVVAVNVPPPPPMAPPLPFSFIGKKSEGGAWEVFLARGDLSYIVHEGMTFAESYRVNSIKPPDMTLTFIPLEQTQVMNIGMAQ